MTTFDYARIYSLIVLVAIETPFVVGGEPATAAPRVGPDKCDMCKVAPPVMLAGLTEGDWLALESRKMVWPAETTVTLQDGKKHPLIELLNRPTALTFLYTRCDNPQKCPLVATTMAKLQERVKNAGLEGKVRLCVMTYDPEYDSNQILKAYAMEKGIMCNENVMMLRPDPSDKKKLFDAMSVTVNYNDTHVNIHGIQLLLLDKKGRLAKSYHTLIWDNAKVLEDLKRLLSEDVK